ncbi:hypothetical protein BU23DRAFT_276767 [Bimuria novae-zelandiae CBS 107.79]|uniref:Uncharacterized protein n=1 Tax=Bimuria novae-zelandiae CBS 107.79 TaxID=1447943 RepID=A0A6A5VM45_9PLEO|nr:hypothetical protein BU23DRAFT_276767 [Bimuria novae-zelandiae CBS 107.79]
MKFFAVAAALVAAVAAQGYDTGAGTCSIVTVTETVTVPSGATNTPIAPSAPSAAPSLPPYPTGEAPYPSVPASSGTAAPVAPSYPAGAPVPSGTGAPAPSGTGVYTPPPYFTGAASGNQVAGFVAGVGAVAAFFL